MKPTMKPEVIKKRKEALRQQLLELEAEERRITKLEREKEAVLQKKLHENNRNALGELMLKLIANEFADVDFDSLKRDAAAIVKQNACDTNKRQEKTSEIDDDSTDEVESELESSDSKTIKTPSSVLHTDSAY